MLFPDPRPDPCQEKLWCTRDGRWVSAVRRETKEQGGHRNLIRELFGAGCNQLAAAKDRSTECYGHIEAVSHHQGCQLPTQHLAMDHHPGSNAGRG
jgi:hypothetical protein